MAKRYIVDVSHLSAKEQQRVYEQIVIAAFITNRVFGTDGKISSLDVIWDSSEDFTSSPFIPVDCPVREI